MKVYVFSPSNSVAGGAECMHQIVRSLNDSNFKAFITYYNGRDGGKAINYFSNYDCPIFLGNLNDIDLEQNFVIYPEIATLFLKKIKRAKKIIYWASIDNYLGNKENLSIKNQIKNRLKYLLGISSVSIFGMKEYYHFTQSYYASNFIKNKGYTHYHIGDYISNDFEIKIPDKKNTIIYNPKKGAKFINGFKKLYDDYNFVPLINLSRQEMIKKIAESKLYLDFGLHPGKDRIPREAVKLNCCIITGKFGSSGNEFDIPIPDYYKIDAQMKNSFFENLKSKIDYVLNNFDKSSKDFDVYRNKVAFEKIFFDKSIKHFFNHFNF